MKTRKLLLAANNLRLPSLKMATQCNIRLFILILVSTIVIQQELSNYSSSSYVVAKSFSTNNNDEFSSSQKQTSTTANFHQSQTKSFNHEQTQSDIDNQNSMQSTTTAQQQQLQPEAAAISSPSTSHLKPPVIVSKPEEIIVAPGSNVTLACSAQGSQPLTFVWFQDEKNLTKTNAPSTKLLEEKRYEIFEEIGTSNTTTSILYLMNLRLTDTSLFLCWVENAAGYTFENYSLIVSDTLKPGQALTTSNLYQPSAQNDHIVSSYPSYPITILGLVALVLAGVICVALQIYNCRQDRDGADDDCRHDGKSVNKSSNDFKKKPSSNNGNNDTMGHHEKSLSNSGSAGGKYTPVSTMDSGGEDYDEDGGDVDNDDLSQTSSCNKNNFRVLAVNDLDGFIEQMRSGIINMDYHSMSPVIQFNNTNTNNNNNNSNIIKDDTSLSNATTVLAHNNINTMSPHINNTLRPRSVMQTSVEPSYQHQLQQQQQQLYNSNNNIYHHHHHQQQASSYQPTAAYHQQQSSYQLKQQQPTPQPFSHHHHHLQQLTISQQTTNGQLQQQKPSPTQSYQLAYAMNHFPSSSSGSSQTPFANFGGNGYYY